MECFFVLLYPIFICAHLERHVFMRSSFADEIHSKLDFLRRKLNLFSPSILQKGKVSSQSRSLSIFALLISSVEKSSSGSHQQLIKELKNI